MVSELPAKLVAVMSTILIAVLVSVVGLAHKSHKAIACVRLKLVWKIHLLLLLLWTTKRRQSIGRSDQVQEGIGSFTHVSASTGLSYLKDIHKT